MPSPAGVPGGRKPSAPAAAPSWAAVERAADAASQYAAFGSVDWGMAARSTAAQEGAAAGALGFLPPGTPAGLGIKPVAEGVAKGAATGAESAVNGLKLNKSLASQAQIGESGTTLAGVSAGVPFRDAARVAKEHGGNAADWVKKSSSSYTARDGMTFETHWVQNMRTGQRVEFKTKIPGGD